MPGRVAGMTTHDYLKARLLYVRQDFDEVLEKLNDADLPWRPAEGMPSIAGSPHRDREQGKGADRLAAKWRMARRRS